MRAREFLSEKVLSKFELLKHDKKYAKILLSKAKNGPVDIDPSKKNIYGDQVILSPATIKNLEDFIMGKDLFDNPTFIINNEETPGKWSALHKGPDFSNRYNPYGREQGQIQSLDSLFKDKLNNDKFLRLTVGDRVVEAFGLRKSPEGVKSDLEILGENEQPIAWISLKHGTEPKHFGQWSGITEFSLHPEVKGFADQIKSKVVNQGETYPKKITYGTKINDQKLKSQACFGKDYGSKQRGINNVDLILQGQPVIEKSSNNTYKITADRMWINGNIPSENYEPILIVRFASDRSNYGIPGARISIYPTQGRPWVDINQVPEKETNKNIQTTQTQSSNIQNQNLNKIELPPENS